MKICLYGNLSSTLNGSPIGGGELQLIYLAKELAHTGEKVVIVDLEGDKDYNHSENLEVISFNKFISNKSRFLKYFYLYLLLKSLNADVYHCRIRGWIHIIPFLASKKNNSIFSLSLASDLDVGNFCQRYKHFYRYKGFNYFITQGILTEVIFPLILKKANIVFVQNQYQKNKIDMQKINNEFLLNIFNPDEIVINNLINTETEYIVYVGSLDARKGFDTFIQIANTLKQISFKVVGNYRGSSNSTNLRNNNVQFLGRLPRVETLNVISKAKALLSTSPMEGFPNVFLESWANGVPVISYAVNPNNLLDSKKLGLFCEKSSKKLSKYLTEIDKYDFNSEELADYVYQNHGAEKNVKNFKNIIYQLNKNKKNTSNKCNYR